MCGDRDGSWGGREAENAQCDVGAAAGPGLHAVEEGSTGKTDAGSGRPVSCAVGVRLEASAKNPENILQQSGSPFDRRRRQRLLLGSRPRKDRHTSTGFHIPTKDSFTQHEFRE